MHSIGGINNEKICKNYQYRAHSRFTPWRLFRLYEERIELYREYANYIIGNNGSSEATVENLVKYVRGEFDEKDFGN